MKAGPLKYKLQIQKLVQGVDSFGSDTTQYVPTKTVHAERVKLSGRRSEEVSEHFYDYSVEFRIRIAHEIKEGWLVRQLGGYLYRVVTIVPNLELGMNTLVCERINE